MKRRSFLKVVGGAVAGATAGVRSTLGLESSPALQGEAARNAQAKNAHSKDGPAEHGLAKGEPSSGGESVVAGLPRRVLGRTGELVSVVGFPGLALARLDQEQCNAGVKRAFERGVNYFDVAPAYGDAEVKMGIALQALDRSRIFLASKTKMRDAEGARAELERSLKRLKTKRFDLYQLHHIRTPEEVKRALGPGGAIETLKKARDDGKVRFLGFSAHTTKGALEAMKGFRFDTVMFPINFVEHFAMGFGKAVLEEAERQGAAVLAIKALSRGEWPEGVKRTKDWWYRPVEDEEEVRLALSFTLALKPVVVGFPPAFLDVLEKAVAAGPSCRPLTEAETAKLREIAAACPSVFKKEEDRVACGGRHPHHPGERLFPGSPHEGCPGAIG